MPLLADASGCAHPTTTCAPCLLGALTATLTFPYNITQTLDVEVIPYVTGLPNGTNCTYSYETITPTHVPIGTGVPIVFDNNSTLTWVTDGATLTYPTTYASFYNFTGVAAPTAAPTACLSSKDLGPITLPATTAPAAFIYTPAVGTDAMMELTYGHLPTPLLGYLGSLTTVVQQLGGNQPSKCAPTWQHDPIACTRPPPFVNATSTIPPHHRYLQPTAFPNHTNASQNLSMITLNLTGTFLSPFPTLEPTQNNLMEPPPGGAPPAIDKIPAVALRRREGKPNFTPYNPADADKTKPDIVLPQNLGPGSDDHSGDNNNGGSNQAAQQSSDQHQSWSPAPNPDNYGGSSSTSPKHGQSHDASGAGSDTAHQGPAQEHKSPSTWISGHQGDSSSTSPEHGTSRNSNAGISSSPGGLQHTTGSIDQFGGGMDHSSGSSASEASGGGSTLPASSEKEGAWTGSPGGSNNGGGGSGGPSSSEGGTTSTSVSGYIESGLSHGSSSSSTSSPAGPAGSPQPGSQSSSGGTSPGQVPGTVPGNQNPDSQEQGGSASGSPGQPSSSNGNGNGTPASGSLPHAGSSTPSQKSLGSIAGRPCMLALAAGLTIVAIAAVS